MISRIGLQFGRWNLCDKIERLYLVESIGLLFLVLFMIPFPRLDMLLAPAGYIYLGPLCPWFMVALIEETPG